MGRPVPKLLVANGYDRIAEGYLRLQRPAPSEHKRTYLDRLTEGLPDDAWVLDLGCGSGLPHTAYLSERFRVVGIDISREQLALARRHVASASFVLADMCSLQFRAQSLNAIAAIYSIIHVPREEHEPLLRNLYDFLKPGGRLFAVLGAHAWEGTESDWLSLGSEMFWSHFDAATGLGLLQTIGFRTIASNIEPDNMGDGSHLFVLAEKPE